MVHKNNLIIEINFISSSKQPVNKVQITSMILHHTSPLAYSILTMVDSHFTASGFFGKVSQQTRKVSLQTRKLSQQSGKFSQQSGKVSQQVGKVSQQSGKVSQLTGKVSQQTGKVSQHQFAVK